MARLHYTQPEDSEDIVEDAKAVAAQQLAARKALLAAGINSYNDSTLDRIYNIDECVVDNGHVFLFLFFILSLLCIHILFLFLDCCRRVDI